MTDATTSTSKPIPSTPSNSGNTDSFSALPANGKLFLSPGQIFYGPEMGGYRIRNSMVWIGRELRLWGLVLLNGRRGRFVYMLRRLRYRPLKPTLASVLWDFFRGICLFLVCEYTRNTWPFNAIYKRRRTPIHGRRSETRR